VYKLTAICSPELSSKVVIQLESEPEVSNVLTTKSLSGEENLIVVSALVHREAIDIVLEHLRSFHHWAAGELSFIEVDYAAHHNLDTIEDDSKNDDDEDIIGWEIILDLAHSKSRLTWWYLVFMVCAGLIASVGLVANLPVLILGAMSLSPDLAPTNAITVGLTAGAWRNAFQSLRTLLLGLVVAVVISFVATKFLEFSGIHDGFLDVNDDLETFVTVVDSATLIVALTAGVAAMTAFVTSQATTAVGVAISVTTIPAAAYAGVAIASDSLENGGAAIIVLVVNILCLILAQMITLKIIRAWRTRKRKRLLDAGF
jgi:uncharacterized hydrophobic protein (TIGR00271 family)